MRGYSLGTGRARIVQTRILPCIRPGLTIQETHAECYYPDLEFPRRSMYAGAARRLLVESVEVVSMTTTWSHLEPADRIHGEIPIQDTFTISCPAVWPSGWKEG